MLSLQDLQKLIQPLRNRVMLMVARGVLRLCNDSGGLQHAQVSLLEGELRDKVERVQDYGFTSVPLPGAEAVTLFVGGNRDHGLIIKVDDRRYRLTGLKGGEVALYTDEGDSIHLQRQNIIRVKTKKWVVDAEDEVTINTKNFDVFASESAAISAPLFGLYADAIDAGSRMGGETSANIVGGLSSTGDQVAGGVSQMQHPHSNVQPGSGTSGPPVGG